METKLYLSWGAWLISLLPSSSAFHFLEMNKQHYSPSLDLLCLTGTEVPLEKGHSLSSPLRCAKTKPLGEGGARTSHPPRAGDDIRGVTGAEAGRAAPPGEACPRGGEGCLCLHVSETAHQVWLDLGLPAAVFRGAFVLSTHILWGFQGRPFLSLLMNALAVSEHGAVSACPGECLFSLLLRLTRTCIHELLLDVFFFSDNPSSSDLNRKTTAERKVSARKLGFPGFLLFFFSHLNSSSVTSAYYL